MTTIRAVETPASTRRIKPGFPLLVVGLLVAVSVAVSITALHNQSDKRRQGQILLSRLSGIASQLSTLEWEILAKQSLETETDIKVSTLEAQGAQYLHTLERLELHESRLLLVNRAETAYQAVLENEITLLAAGEASLAHDAHTERGVPRFAELQEAIDLADKRFDIDSARAKRLADVGSTTSLILAALAMSLLFRRSAKERTRNIAALMAAEQKALRQSEEQFRSLIRNTSDVILVLDAQGICRYISPAVHRVLGYNPDQRLGENSLDLIHPEDHKRLETAFRQVAAQGGQVGIECRIRHADASYRHIEVIANNLLSEPGIEGILVTYRDVTERKAFEEQLAYQAFHDALTGLPNRALLLDRLASALARAERKASAVAVIFIDLDNFKIINDSMGHEAGDNLLITIAERLKACVRPGDTVARLGGDEFTILLEDLKATEEAILVVERLFENLHQPVILQGREVFASASVGIAVGEKTSALPDDLLRDADTAMYQAKTSGKAGYVLFHASMKELADEHMELEQDLRVALDNKELRLMFQPILDLRTNQVCEVEALLRWDHPTRGLISPVKFIPIAEKTGLIVPIGKWVLEESCRQAECWNRASPFSPLTIGVNVSAKQLQQPQFFESVRVVLEQTGLVPAQLKLEITESLMVQNFEATVQVLHQLKALGIRLAIDDFGTGYSSMAYLHNLPVDTLKIDRSFVQRLGEKAESRSVIEAIIHLAKTLNMKVTSEGIETPEQLQQLMDIGADLGQGYYFAKPLSKTAMEELMTKQAFANQSLQELIESSGDIMEAMAS